jgi:hypothetical protein
VFKGGSVFHTVLPQTLPAEGTVLSFICLEVRDAILCSVIFFLGQNGGTSYHHLLCRTRCHPPWQHVIKGNVMTYVHVVIP